MEEFAGGLVTNENGYPTIDALQNKLFELGYPKTIRPEDGTLPSQISAVDPDFKMPEVWKTSLAIDYVVPVGFPLTITAEGIFNKTIYGVTMQDWSIPDVADLHASTVLTTARYSLPDTTKMLCLLMCCLTHTRATDGAQACQHTHLLQRTSTSWLPIHTPALRSLQVCPDLRFFYNSISAFSRRS